MAMPLRNTGAVFALLVLCACAGGGTQPAGLPAGLPQIALDPHVVAAAQDAVRQQLRDPASAQFNGLRAFQGKSAVEVCGFVNGRNGFGGYTGFVPFNAGVVIVTNQQGQRFYNSAGAVIAEPTDSGINIFYRVVGLCAP
jgi:hypothetical protein